MSLMMNFMREKNISVLDTEDWDSYTSVANMTGYNAVDVFSGSLEYDTNGLPRLNGGLHSRAITIVGESTTGKTTLALKLGSSIIDRWNRLYGNMAEMYFRDIEDNTPIRRIKTVTGWSDNQIINSLNYSNTACSVTDIYNEIRAISDVKEKLRKQLTVKTGIRDIDGAEIEVLSPTVYITDSIAALNPDGIPDFEFDKSGNLKEVEKISGNIDAARDAKSNTAFIKKVKSYLSKYNIILIMINHITEEMSTSMYDVPTRFLTFLKPGQKLKGGKELVYQSFAIINLTVKTRINDKEPIYGDKIRGSVTHLTFIKNKSNVEGIGIPMVFDQKTGYRPELSDWEYLYSKNYGFSGSPASYYLKVLPEVKFTRKTLYNTCLSNPLLARAMSFTARAAMISDGIFGSLPLDYDGFADKYSYEERVTWILTFTEPYPGYENEHIYIPLELEETALKNQYKIIQNAKCFNRDGNFIIDENYFYEIMEVPGEGEPVFVPGSFAYSTPFDESIHEEEGDYIFPSEEE